MKTKYNKSEIFSSAWSIFRTGKSLSESLKMAWAAAKAPKMIGSEKQITWAAEIKSAAIASLESTIARFNRIPSIAQKAQDRLNLVRSLNDAAYIINKRESLHLHTLSLDQSWGF